MALPNNLMKRDGTYYARIYVPLDLQATMQGTTGKPKREIWESLRTKDPQEARRRLRIVLDTWDGNFADMRRRQSLGGDDIAKAIAEHYQAKLDQGDKERIAPTESEIWAAFDLALAERSRKEKELGPGAFDAINAMTDVELLAHKTVWSADRRRRRLARLKADLGAGDTRLIEIDADEFIRVRGFRVVKGTQTYRDLCLGMLRAEIEAHQRTFEREGGDFGGQVNDPVVLDAISRPAPITTDPVTGESLLDLFDRYERANPTNMLPGTMKGIRVAVEHFAKFVGPSFRPDQISSAKVAAWMDVLYEFPVMGKQANMFKGLSITEAVAANKALAEPKKTMAVNNIRKYLSALSGFCVWLKKRDVLPSNPVAGMAPARDESNKRLPFSVAQVQALFASPLMTGCKGESYQEMSQPGSLLIRDHRYWVPLVMAYSGARPGEIAQLHVEDVRERHGMWVMHITSLGDNDKRTKTDSSNRSVPVHSELIRLGFLEHCTKARRAGDLQVFPEVELRPDAQVAATFSKGMNGHYLPAVGLKSGPRHVLYSLRHTFIDQLRLAEFMDSEIAMIVGHDAATMTKRYGTEQQGTLQHRQRLIEAVTYKTDQKTT